MLQRHIRRRRCPRHRMVAAFARKQAAIDWAMMKSFDDESRFTVHTAEKVVDAYRDGESEYHE